jgi:hypothetical protein
MLLALVLASTLIQGSQSDSSTLATRAVEVIGKTICSPNAVGGIAGIGTAGNSGGYDGSDSCVANELDRCDSASR